MWLPLVRSCLPKIYGGGSDLGHTSLDFHYIFVFSFFLGICAKDDECKNQDIPTISKPNLEKFFFDLENTIRDLMMPQQTRNSLQEEKLIEDI